MLLRRIDLDEGHSVLLSIEDVSMLVGILMRTLVHAKTAIDFLLEVVRSHYTRPRFTLLCLKVGS